MYRTGVSPLTPIPAQLWHGHEMLFGFVTATIAGFMLTAVPSWTGRRGFAGAPLVALTLLWMLGRVVFAVADLIPSALLVVGELLFVPALILVIAPSLLRVPNRNSPLLLVLAAFWVLDAVFLWGVLHSESLLARHALLSAVDLVLLLITVIGGRIVPAFTANSHRQRGVVAQLRSGRGTERRVIGSMVLLVFVGLIRPRSELVAAIALLASLAHFVRMAGWQTIHTFRNPIVWILHAGYVWLPIGLALKGLHFLGGYAPGAHWLHALTIGGATTMILAVMTRAGLGHTGRPLRVARPIVWAYVALAFAALTRVFGPGLLPFSYPVTMTISTIFWIAAFLLFAVIYTPILLRPRADGRPG
jgi:uncharacterized protein involved in response to NO